MHKLFKYALMSIFLLSTAVHADGLQDELSGYLSSILDFTRIEAAVTEAIEILKPFYKKNKTSRAKELSILLKEQSVGEATWCLRAVVRKQKDYQVSVSVRLEI